MESLLHRERVDFNVHADDFAAALFNMAAGALAEFGKPHVSLLAELQACGDEHRININAVVALKLKQHIDNSKVAGAPAEDPATIGEKRAGKDLNHARGFFPRSGLHLEGPEGALSCFRGCQGECIHVGFIGIGRRELMG